MRNRYPGTCYYCGKYVEVGAGHFEKIVGGRVNGKKWRNIHAECVFKQREEKEKLNQQNENKK